MPIHDFRCSNGHETEDLVRVGTDTVDCPICGEPANRVILRAPSIDYLKMGVDSGFPTCADKWADIQTKKNRGQMKDSANTDNSAHRWRGEEV